MNMALFPDSHLHLVFCVEIQYPVMFQYMVLRKKDPQKSICAFYERGQRGQNNNGKWLCSFLKQIRLT